MTAADLARLMELRSAAAKAAPPRPPPVLATADQLAAAMEKRSAQHGDDDDRSSWADVRRICSLPVAGPLSPEEVEAVSAEASLESAYRRGFRLFERQARALVDFELTSGLMAPIGVGEGKTLLDIKIADTMYTRMGVRKIVLFVPSKNVSSFSRQLPGIRAWVPVSVPIHYIEGDAAHRRARARAGTPGLYVMPYSLLSTKDSSDVLAWIAGDDTKLGLIADEAHNLSRGGTARTARVRRLIHARSESGLQTFFAGMSATLTKRSVRDYAHLMLWALGAGAPVPTTEYLTMRLGMALDSQASPGPHEMQLWAPLQRWARTWFPGETFSSDITGLRKAFLLRSTSTPGVVASSPDNQLDVKLVIRNREPVCVDAKGQAEQNRLMAQVADLYIAPNGDDIAHAIMTHKWLRELTAGFYNEQVWPAAAVVARRARVSEPDAEGLLRAAAAHLEAKQEYTRELRSWLGSHDKDGLDTPHLVGLEMRRNGSKYVGSRLYALWRQAKDLDRVDLPRREPRPVRVCSNKVDDAVLFAQTHITEEEGCVLWVYHQEIAAWLLERLERAGVPRVLPCPAGTADIEDPGNADKVCVASIAAHGEGRNLQHFRMQKAVEWPRAALTCEQLLGRLHRTGQEADVIYMDTNDTNAYDKQVRAAGLIDSLYQSQTMGVPRRVIYAEYDPLPDIMPAEVLRERGFENELLTEYQEKLLRAKFGAATPTLGPTPLPVRVSSPALTAALARGRLPLPNP
jgi:hypothetical protein